MARKKRADRGCGLFWLLLGVAISIESVRLDLGSPRNPGPGFIPFLLGTILEILAVILLIRSFSTKKDASIPSIAILGPNPGKIGIVFFSLVLYGALLSFLGYLLSTFLLMGFLFNMTRREGWFLRLIGAAAVAVLTFLVFRLWMDCPLPRGVLSLGL